MTRISGRPSARRNTFLCGAGLAALLIGATDAGAQTTGAASTSADSAESSAPQLEEILVTAQRRSENIRTVPIAISAVSAATLQAQGVTDSAGLSASVPSLQLNRSFRGGTPFIRGIGNPGSGLGDEGAVAFYIDGVYQTNLIATLFEFNNIERVEVLKGPQGTLFGRNALGGVVQVITRDPTSAARFDLSAGYANYDTIRGSLYASGGIAENLNADIAVQGFSQGKGWGRNLATGNEAYKSNDISARSKWIWAPTGGTRITFAGQYSRNNDFSTSSHLSTIGVTPGVGGLNPGRYNVQVPLDPIAKVTSYGASLKIEQDLGDFARLVNVFGYSRMDMRQRADLDAQPANIVQLDLNGFDRAFNNELQLLSGSGSPVKWVVGFFYLNDKTGYDRSTPGWFQTGGFPGGFFNRYGDQATNSYAGYAQATVPVFSDQTHLTGGIRYTSEKRHLTFVQVQVPALPPGYPVDKSTTYNNFSYRIAADHQIADIGMIYASYTTGFKSGLYNTNAPLDPTVRPETVGAFEAGFKFALLDNRLHIDASAFSYTFDEIQLRKPTGASAGTTSLLNAAKGTSRGIEMSLQALPTDRLSFQAGFAALWTKYTDFTNAPFSHLNPATCFPAPGQTTGTPVGGTTACFGDATGKQLIQSPPFTASFSAQYRLPLGASELRLGAQYSYTGRFYWEGDNRLTNGPRSLVNATATFVAPDERWELGVWVKNLTDKAYAANQGSLPFGDIFLDAPPRTFGVDVRFHFGG